MTTKATGGCLCGGVRLTIDNPPAKVSVCHCSMCRRWTGGPLMALHPEKPLRLDKTDTLTWHRSSEWAERGFCSTCGTSLFYRIVATPDDVIATPGALDDQTMFSGLDVEIFIEEKPDFYDFAGDQRHMTGAEVIAEFSAGGPDDQGEST